MCNVPTCTAKSLTGQQGCAKHYELLVHEKHETVVTCTAAGVSFSKLKVAMMVSAAM